MSTADVIERTCPKCRGKGKHSTLPANFLAPVFTVLVTWKFFTIDSGWISRPTELILLVACAVNVALWWYAAAKGGMTCHRCNGTVGEESRQMEDDL